MYNYKKIKTPGLQKLTFTSLSQSQVSVWLLDLTSTMPKELILLARDCSFAYIIFIYHSISHFFFFLCIMSNFNILKTLTLLNLNAYRAICHFHNPPNSDMDYRIFNVGDLFAFILLLILLRTMALCHSFSQRKN